MEQLPFFMALLVFGLAIFGCGCLSITAYYLYRRLRSTSAANARFLRDATQLVLCSGGFLMIEAATLVWDNLTRRQFPLSIRWICLLILVPVCTNAAVRLLRYYLEQVHNTASSEPSALG
jgi:uncharacterized SAM-binding protein YcdF (DUF218 family)